jgi:hypothetical protein
VLFVWGGGKRRARFFSGAFSEKKSANFYVKKTKKKFSEIRSRVANEAPRHADARYELQLPTRFRHLSRSYVGVEPAVHCRECVDADLGVSRVARDDNTQRRSAILWLSAHRDRQTAEFGFVHDSLRGAAVAYVAHEFELSTAARPHVKNRADEFVAEGIGVILIIIAAALGISHGRKFFSGGEGGLSVAVLVLHSHATNSFCRTVPKRSLFFHKTVRVI